MTDNVAKRFDDILDFIKDINPEEIRRQIRNNNLIQWCYMWQSEANARLSKLAKAVDDEN